MAKKRRARPEREYTYESLHKEREYGLYWYAWLWHILRPVVIGLASLILVFGIVSFAWGKISGQLFAPVNSQDKSERSFVVASGESLTKVSNRLESEKLIRNRSAFKYYADFMGYGQKIKAGEYRLSPSLTMAEIANRLTAGDGKPIVKTITMIPGWTLNDFAAMLVKEGLVPSTESFIQACAQVNNFSQFYYVADLIKLGTVARPYPLEGYLAANTYEVFTNASPDDIIRKLLSQTEGLYEESYHERAQELGLSMDQVLTLASLIEKEAKTADFARVSAVFHNRLKKNMALGSDVTIKYVLRTKRMVLTKADLAINSPYNSYTHKGLPPGPICAPSPKAVQAALYPSQDDMQQGYLFFCSKDPDKGELHFSKTQKEHDQAVRIYAPLWEAFDKKNNNQ